MLRYARYFLLAVLALASILFCIGCGSTGSATTTPPPPITISVSPTSMSLTTGGSQSLSASVANANNTGVTWNATAGSISGSGNTVTYTAPATAGTYSATATSVADTSKSATTMITVTSPPITVAVTPASVTLNTSDQQTLVATVSNTANTNVSWNVDGGTITGSGSTVIYTAPATAGDYTATATSSANVTVSASSKIKVNPRPGQVTVAISPLSVSVNTNATQSFSATVTNATNTAVTWSSTGGTITGTGNTVSFTAPSTPGTYTVTATSVANTTKVANASVTVNAPPPPPPSVGVSLSPQSFTVVAGVPQTITASVINTTNTAVTWSDSSGTITGTGNTVSYSAPSPGNYTITATSVADTTKSATANVTVNTPPPVSVSISPLSVSLNPSGTQSITATVANTTNTGVTWATTGGTVTGTGNTITYTAPSTAGIYNITATSVADPTQAASCNVTVNALPVAVSVSPQTMSLTTGASQGVSATVTGSSNTAVTWSMTGGTITGSGNSVTYNAPSTAGTYSLTATSAADTTKSASSAITVTSPPPPTITISPLSAILSPGNTQVFTANSSAGSGQPFVWTATGGSIVANGSTATYTAPSTVGPYSVSVSISGSTALPASASVTVASNTVQGMSIPTSHPRLWFNAARLSQAKQWYASHAFTPGSTDYLDLALHHVLTGNAADCTAPIGWANDPNLVPVTTGVASDQARWYGEQQILVFDWCYDQLTPTQKSSMISIINGWVTHWTQQQWGGPTMPQSNYYWGYLRDELEWGVTSYQDQPDFSNNASATANAFLADALATRWTNSSVADAAGAGKVGVPTEGSQYGRYALWYPVVPFATAQLLGRNTWTESNQFLASAYYLIYATTPSPTLLRGTTSSFYEVFPFNDDETFVNGQSAASQFTVGTPDKGSYYGEFMLWAANQSGLSSTPGYAKQWLNTVNPSQELFQQSVDGSGNVSPLAFSNLALDFYAPGPQIAYSHAATNWAGSAEVMLKTYTDPGSGHSQDDFGMFQVWRGGAWLSRESASYSQAVAPWGGAPVAWQAGHAYSVGMRVQPSPANGYGYVQTASSCTSGASQPVFPTSSGATVADGSCSWMNLGNDCSENGIAVGSSNLALHNGILVNGKGLACNIADGAPVMRRLESQAGYFYADADLTKAYRNTITDPGRPWRDNAAANHVEREFVFVRGLETLVVLDRVQTNAMYSGNLPAANVKKTFAAECETSWVLEDGSHERCDNGTQSLRISTLLPATVSQRVVNETACPNCTTAGQYRLELDGSGSALSYQLNVLQARASTGLNLTASVADSNPADPTTGTLTVTLHPPSGADTTIIFNKGQTSSGGTIALAGNPAISLRTTVQSVVIGDGGPAWQP